MNHTKELVRTVAKSLALGVLGAVVGAFGLLAVVFHALIFDPVGAGRVLVNLGAYVVSLLPWSTAE